MDITEITKEIHENAKAHGWWDESRSFGEIIALCHSELSEALEEYRNIRPELYYDCAMDEKDPDCICDVECVGCGRFQGYQICEHKGEKPEGIAVELADCIIRILDYCGHTGIDIAEVIRIKHEYNKTRQYKHGGKVI